MMAERGFFFDRDGVVNRDPHPAAYVRSWDQWAWMPGLFELLAEVKSRGFRTVLVTSQKGVGKGLMTLAELETIHQRMQRELGHLRFDAIHAYTGRPGCPFAATPDPQMITAAVERFDLELHASWLVGDADRDMAMGRKAGVGTLVRVLGTKPVGDSGHHLVQDLQEVHSILLAAEP